MGKFHDLHTAKMGERKFNGEAVFTDGTLPLLGEALSGHIDPQSKATLEPPRKLLLWAEGRMVKVCLGAGENFDKWFWSFIGLDAGLERIEEALRDGKGDWVDPSGRRARLAR